MLKQLIERLFSQPLNLKNNKMKKEENLIKVIQEIKVRPTKSIKWHAEIIQRMSEEEFIEAHLDIVPFGKATKREKVSCLKEIYRKNGGTIFKEEKSPKESKELKEVMNTK